MVVPLPGIPWGSPSRAVTCYSRVIYGTHVASVTVGMFSTLGVVLIGGVIGALAGFYGGWIDAILARLGTSSSRCR